MEEMMKSFGGGGDMASMLGGLGGLAGLGGKPKKQVVKVKK